jgi:hypothetical protein
MANALREHYAELLLDRIRADRYPSVNDMNMFEAIATPPMLAEYTLHLFERVEADTYPSIPMMQRVQRLAARWGSTDGAGAREEESQREKRQSRSRRRSS